MSGPTMRVLMTDEQIAEHQRAHAVYTDAFQGLAVALLDVMREQVIVGGNRRIREREQRMRQITDDMLAQARDAGVIP